MTVFKFIQRINARRLILALSSVALLAAAEPEARDLPAASPITIQGKQLAQVYLFAGAAGSRQTITVKGSGPFEVIQLTPGGQIMNVAKGTGEVALETVLSSTDVHPVVVTRENGSAPYTVTRSAVEPTLTGMKLAYQAGYSMAYSTILETSCWIEPGRKRRSSFASDSGTMVTISELAADGTYLKHVTIGSPEWDSTKSYQLQGNNLVEILTDDSGQFRYPSLPIEMSLISPTGWKTYRC
jgi:hypothetical protein